ncbi:MAG: COX15/CtaA family protein [Betaproteobacteria bacterium]|nr:COX15/CtaA family protein [Betaproteobacteria bacterium]
MDDPARKALQMAHRYGAFLAAAYLAALGARALCAGGPLWNAGATVLALVLVQTGMGALALPLGFPLALMVAHNAGAALLLLAVTHLAQRARPAAQGP